MALGLPALLSLSVGGDSGDCPHASRLVNSGSQEAGHGALAGEEALYPTALLSRNGGSEDPGEGRLAFGAHPHSLAHQRGQ